MSDTERRPNQPPPEDAIEKQDEIITDNDYGMGLLPSPYDARDYDAAHLLEEIQRDAVGAVRSIRQRKPPGTVSSDLTALMPGVWNQGPHGACTSNVADLVEYARRRNHLPQRDPAHAAQWTWTKARRGLANVAKNVGASIFESIATARDKGIAREASYPYRTPNVYTLPPEPVGREAELNQALAFFRANPDDFATVIAILGQQRWPLSVGLPIHDGFKPNPYTGLIPYPSDSATIRGYHMVKAVGFKTARSGKLIRIENSWGGYWGQGGYAWLTPEFWRDFVFDPFVITAVENGNVAGTNVALDVFRS